MPRLFLTGTSGFVGRRMLHLLIQGSFSDVRLLTRNPARLTGEIAIPPGWRVVEGALEEPGGWTPQLQGVETVVHLAAATGKVPRKTHFEVTLEGTRQLLERAQHAGVRRFLFVSSNAVSYRHRPHYHYADAKAAAESLVRSSELDWLILRPTLVLGPGSPLQASLRRLALLPVPLLFGAGVERVQPIHVDDLARVLVAALAIDPWGGRTIAVGGPEVLSIEELMARIRTLAKHDHPRFRHIPLALARGLLGIVEPVLFPLLPFTAGQLAFFANSTVAEPDPFLDRLPSPRLDVRAMLTDPGPS